MKEYQLLFKAHLVMNFGVLLNHIKDGGEWIAQCTNCGEKYILLQTSNKDRVKCLACNEISQMPPHLK